jgi:hypothetical protein
LFVILPDFKFLALNFNVSEKFTSFMRVGHVSRLLLKRIFPFRKIVKISNVQLSPLKPALLRQKFSKNLLKNCIWELRAGGYLTADFEGPEIQPLCPVLKLFQ